METQDCPTLKANAVITKSWVDSMHGQLYQASILPLNG